MSDYIPVGYVRRAHGIRGDVVVRGLVSDAAERLVKGVELRTAPPDSTPFRIAAHRQHQGDVVVHLEGIEDRTTAEGLVGTQFVIGVEERRTLDEDEWWAEDLEGCRVVDTEGVVLGTVVDVITGSAQDRLAVHTVDGRSGEIPFVEPLVLEVDADRRAIVVDLPEGLFD